MHRRDFFKAAALLYASKQNLFADETNVISDFFSKLFFNDEKKYVVLDKETLQKKEIILKQEQIKKSAEAIIEEESNIADNLQSEKTQLKSNNLIKKDIYIEDKYKNDFISVRKKLAAIQSYVGYGNFNITSFDYSLKIAKNVSSIGQFTKSELEFLESIFYYDPKMHGFYGERISKNITDKIDIKEVVKIPYTGHYLFRGHSEETYYKMVEDIGESMVLTSGIRSIVKQTKLFLDKLDSENGNFTVAAKSLAPPAYTYHTIGDFDVGKKGFGHANFTSRFALTQEFLAMRKLKYIDMRYTINNKDGVRYEPWHVKVI
ncbi:M15 family metallopeptidase [Arcobacter arenosus]|jgi:hypothetical protein|uniref:Peptidase M15 n=1 Tax=Arcobacter arenosus TaxID=2576037 RepID=A0A5R8Y1E2_9BACT|nr:M15 family metallopeptidase [Arcobacter arenosus]TLP38606.1 peptidase M15 [Arcobacter arenosus]